MSGSQLPQDHEPFTEESAARALRAAVRIIGAALPADIRLLRLGENALFVSPTLSLVYRVARSDALIEKVEKELATAAWLLSQGYPGLPPRDDLPQPVNAEGRLVTFWEYVPPSGTPASFTDLAVLLRELHALPPPDFPVPDLDPFPVMRLRLDRASEDNGNGGVPEKDLEFLSAACTSVEAGFKDFVSSDPTRGLIHGDAHRGNVLRRRDGVALLIDFEAVALGPRAWDLMPTAMAVDRFGLDPAEYAEFCDIYGADVTKDPGYRVLRAVRELGMTTWLMQNVSHSSAAAQEFTVRMESLRKGDHAARWHAR
ncbi:aminoglycoside phosphotransferase family protein [Streptomyces sp. NPDC019396]|uniref:aminoglycoside phosphotransferase family protein n=1 Tax=Streptomyces sp. NPDC019396 TaxID=3154687 RepID=UPI0033C9A0C1